MREKKEDLLILTIKILISTYRHVKITQLRNISKIFFFITLSLIFGVLQNAHLVKPSQYFDIQFEDEKKKAVTQIFTLTLIGKLKREEKKINAKKKILRFCFSIVCEE